MTVAYYFQLLRKILGGDEWPEHLPTGENVEEVSLMPFDEGRYERRGHGSGVREAYQDDDDDEYEGFPMGGGAQRVQCAQS